MLKDGADVPDRWRNWTAVDDDEGKAAYKCWVREASKVTGRQGVSLAVWELFVWKPQ